MAAENDTPPKDDQQADGRRKAGVTLDLAAEASSEQPPVAAGTETTATGDVSATAGEDAGPQADNAEPSPPASAGPARSSPAIVALVLAGVVGGVVALALGYGLQVTGVLPAPGLTTANEARDATEGLKDTMTGLDQRLTSIEAASARAIADRALLDDLSRQVGVVDAFGESLSDRLLKAEAAMAALKEDTGATDGSDMQQTLDSLSKRVMRLETMPPPAAGNSDAQQQKLDALSKRVERLETLPSPTPSVPAAMPAAEATAAVASAPPAADNGAVRAAALSAFQLAAARGGPFADALANLDKLGVNSTTVAALKPLAEKGVPSRGQLVEQFPKVADAILATESVASDDASLLDRLTSYGRRLVKVRPAGSPAGDETAAIVTRMRSAVDAGDLAKALNERQALPAEGQMVSETWAGAVADRLEIDRLVEAIAAGAGNGSG
jgi:hypothetical protein